MKCLLTLLFLVTSCGPYYVGTKPVDAAEELVASIPKVIAKTPVQEPTMAEPDEPAKAGPLIGWDGKEVSSNNRPLHGIDTGDDTHGNLLSMYMDSKQEVDQLKLELRSMADLQSKQDVLIETLRRELGDRDATIADSEGRLLSEQSVRQNLEGRLVTAQIRRLEAEKQLLVNLLSQDLEGAQPVAETVAQTNQ